MKPIRTATCDAVFTGDGADVEDVFVELRTVEAAASFDGAKEIRVYWMPTDEERQRIAAGENIRISMLHGVSPHWLDVVEAEEIVQ